MLEVKNVEKVYNRNKGIKDITFALKEGEICALLGKNGSGKTTLLKCILDLVEKNHGEILLDGKKVSEQYEKVAFISADGSAISYMKVIEYGHFLKKYYESFNFDEYIQLCRHLKVEEFHRIQELSKGEKMKVEIAAGCAMHAKLIVLDEPFTSLDIYAKEDALKLLLKQLNEDVIILVSTHDIDEIEGIADRCIVLNDGKKVEDFYLDDLHDKGIELKEFLQKYRPD